MHLLTWLIDLRTFEKTYFLPQHEREWQLSSRWLGFFEYCQTFQCLQTKKAAGAAWWTEILNILSRCFRANCWNQWSYCLFLPSYLSCAALCPALMKPVWLKMSWCVKSAEVKLSSGFTQDSLIEKERLLWRTEAALSCSLWFHSLCETMCLCIIITSLSASETTPITMSFCVCCVCLSVPTAQLVRNVKSHIQWIYIVVSLFKTTCVHKYWSGLETLHKREHAHLMNVTTFGSAKVSRVFYVILGMHGVFFFRDNNFTFYIFKRISQMIYSSSSCSFCTSLCYQGAYCHLLRKRYCQQARTPLKKRFLISTGFFLDK